MNLNFYNLSESQVDLKVSNSTIFYLYSKKYKTRTFYKSFNKIRGSYKDLVVKNTIYISSNGLKKTGVFAKHEFNFNILQSKFTSFVCYFGLLEDKFFKFAFHSQFYLKKLRKKYLINKELINTMSKKLININERPILSKFPLNTLFFLRQKNNWYGSFNKVVMIRNWYRKLLALTSAGHFFKIRKKNFRARLFLSRWLRFKLKRYFRKVYFRIIRNSYKVLRFYIRTALVKNKNSRLACNIILYLKHLKFLKQRFLKFWKKRWFRWKRGRRRLKLGWRFLHLNKSYRKTKKFLKFFYYVSIKKYLFNLTSNIWLKDLFFSKVYNIFNKDNEEITKSKFLLKINTITVENRFKLMSFIDLFINLKLINFVKFSINHLTYLQTYYTIKSLIVEEYSVNSVNKYLFFKSNVIYSNIYDLFILKVKNTIASVYSVFKSVKYFRILSLNKKFNFKQLRINFYIKKLSKIQLYKFFWRKELLYNLIILKKIYSKLISFNIKKIIYKTNFSDSKITINKLYLNFLARKIISFNKILKKYKYQKNNLINFKKIIQILFYLFKLKFLKFSGIKSNLKKIYLLKKNNFQVKNNEIDILQKKFFLKKILYKFIAKAIKRRKFTKKNINNKININTSDSNYESNKIANFILDQQQFVDLKMIKNFFKIKKLIRYKKYKIDLNNKKIKKYLKTKKFRKFRRFRRFRRFIKFKKFSNTKKIRKSRKLIKSKRFKKIKKINQFNNLINISKIYVYT